MSISIFAGRVKGLSLALVNDTNLRPTAVTLRRKVFDRFQDLSGAIFYDLFAGSGAMGIEAFSRGADQVYLNELSKKFYKILQQNVASIKKFEYDPSEYFYLSNQDAGQFLQRNELNQSHSFVFIDPPYEKLNLYQLCLAKLEETSFAGTVLVEACRQKAFAAKNLEQWLEIDKVYEQATRYIVVGKCKARRGP
jgi:16S rRNA (guanine(966)-N(2))-methyltransferase RsmD